MKKLFLSGCFLLLFSFTCFSQSDSASPSKTDSSFTFHFLKYLCIRGGFGVGIGNYRNSYVIPNDGGMIDVAAGIMYNHVGIIASVGCNYSHFRINTNDYYSGGSTESLNATDFKAYNALAGVWIPFKFFDKVSMNLKLLAGAAILSLPEVASNSKNFIYTPNYITHTEIETPYTISQTIASNSIITAAIGIDLSLRIMLKKHFYAELPYFYFIETPYTSFNSRIYSTNYYPNVLPVPNSSVKNYTIQTTYINIGVGIAYRFQGSYGIKNQDF